jgi:ribosomal protein S21
MSINAEVSKTGSESTLSVIRKFSRRVQGTGLIKNSRKTRYYERSKSKTVQKKRALKLIKRRADFKQLVKEGKAPEAPVRRGYQQRETTTTSQTPSTSRFGESTPIAR